MSNLLTELSLLFLVAAAFSFSATCLFGSMVGWIKEHEISDRGQAFFLFTVIVSGSVLLASVSS